MTPPIARPSPNHDARSRPPELIVLHYTGMQDAETALARLTDPAPTAGRYPGPWQSPDLDPATPLGRVSAHYVVGEDGAVFALVPEERRAWHAGASFWAGEGEVNGRSIGIEIVNGGHDFGLPPYSEAQIAAVTALVADIAHRHKIGPHRVVGHSDIAPERKADPGEHFPWARLAEAGLALAPRAIPSPSAARIAGPGDAGPAVLAAQEGLAALGYGCPQSGEYDGLTTAVMTAFQRRFRPERIDGVCDDHCAALLADLGAQTAALTIARLRS